MKRNPGAAAGTAMMGAASAAFWVMAAKGLALASLPFLGVAALLVLGYCVYSTYLDSKTLSFLKTCLWNRVFQAERNMLQGAFVPCLTDIALPALKNLERACCQGITRHVSAKRQL